MKMKQFLIPGVAIVIIGIMLFIAFGRDTTSNNTNKLLPIQNEGANETNYVTYSPENLKNAQEQGRAVLYFWAVWCPTCKVLDAELKEQGNELPSDVTILQVNYDTEEELKKQYGITQQHTLVQIDKDGSEIHKWIGGGIETIKQQLK